MNIRVWVGCVLVMGFTVSGCSSRDADAPAAGGNSYEKYQAASDPATTLVKRCSLEAGIPENQPGHKITPDEMSRLTTCLDAAKR